VNKKKGEECNKVVCVNANSREKRDPEIGCCWKGYWWGVRSEGHQGPKELGKKREGRGWEKFLEPRHFVGGGRGGSILRVQMWRVSCGI